MTERLIASDKSDSSLSSEGEALEELRKRDRSKSRSTAGSSSRAEKNKRLIRKLGTTLLDSNGESEDEEINKLQKIIQDQAKELNDERQTSKKVSLHKHSFSILRNIKIENIFHYKIQVESAGQAAETRDQTVAKRGNW